MAVRTSIRYAVAGLLLIAAVGEAVFDGGGFYTASAVSFGVLALLALAAAAAFDPSTALRAVRRPTAIILMLLGALGVLSSVWTAGTAGAALHWGLVTIGYGALLVTSWVVCQRPEARWGVALLIATAALVCGAIGLYGAASFIQPIANHTTGFWRPAGTLGYSSALGLLEVAALPTVLVGMAHRSMRIASLASFAGAVAAIALALGQARLECAMAVLVCGAAVALPRRTIRATRQVAVRAVALLFLAALAAYVVAGLKVSYDAHTHQLPRLVGLASICVAATVFWVLVRTPSLKRGARFGGLAGVLTIEAVIVVVSAITGDTSHVVYVLNGGFFHGRVGIWSGAIAAAGQHLLVGHGADYSLISTPVPLPGDAIADAYDLPLELFVELGILGLLLVLALYAAVLRRVWLSRARWSTWLFGPAVVGFLLADLVDWEWHLAGSGAIWAVAVGALGARAAPVRIYRNAAGATAARSGPVVARDQAVPSGGG